MDDDLRQTIARTIISSPTVEMLIFGKKNQKIRVREMLLLIQVLKD